MRKKSENGTEPGGDLESTRAMAATMTKRGRGLWIRWSLGSAMRNVLDDRRLMIAEVVVPVAAR